MINREKHISDITTASKNLFDVKYAGDKATEMDVAVNALWTEVMDELKTIDLLSSDLLSSLVQQLKEINRIDNDYRAVCYGIMKNMGEDVLYETAFIDSIKRMFGDDIYNKWWNTYGFKK